MYCSLILIVRRSNSSTCRSPLQGSTNGVFVNDIKIVEKVLQDGDIVQFGGAADIPVGTRFGGSGSHVRWE